MKFGDTNTKLFELVKCPDFMSRETGGLAGKDKIRKERRTKFVVKLVR